MEVSYDRCPRCGAEFRGARCGTCAKAPSLPPRAAVSLRPEPPAAPRWERALAWSVRLGSVFFAALLLGTCYARCGERPAFLDLRTDADGPSIASARSVLVFLHGYGGSIGDSEWLRTELRKADVSQDVAIVLVDGPFSTGFGRSWGDGQPLEAKSVERVKELLANELGDDMPPARVVIAGFSQGAGIAAEVAAADPRVGTLVSLSGCRFPPKEAFAQRKGLRVLVAHGSGDSVCSVGRSRGLVDGLRALGTDVRYVEFQGNHVIAPEVIAALAELLGRGK